MICAQIEDPHEVSLPKSGLTTFEDAESGEVITMDLSDKNFQKNMLMQFNPNITISMENLNEEESTLLSFSTTVDFDKSLKEFFHLRKSRRR